MRFSSGGRVGRCSSTAAVRSISRPRTSAGRGCCELLDRGVTRLDRVLATHPHADHVLGLLAVVEELPVGKVWLSAGADESSLFGRLRAAARSGGVPVEILATGRVLALPDARLTVVHSGGLPRKGDPVNNQSVVATSSGEVGGRS